MPFLLYSPSHSYDYEDANTNQQSARGIGHLEDRRRYDQTVSHSRRKDKKTPINHRLHPYHPQSAVNSSKVSHHPSAASSTLQSDNHEPSTIPASSNTSNTNGTLLLQPPTPTGTGTCYNPIVIVWCCLSPLIKIYVVIIDAGTLSVASLWVCL